MHFLIFALGVLIRSLGRPLAHGLPALLLALTAHSQVTNLQIQQRAGTKVVDIVYDLSGQPGVSQTVGFEATRDGGATYEPLTSLSGAVGAGQLPGLGKTAIWNAGEEWPSLRFPGVRVRASATTGGTGVVEGAVRDGLTTSSLAGVQLQFFSGPTLVGTATTSASGNYSITLPSGSLSAQVSRAGYVSTTLNVTVPAGQTVEADLVLFAPQRSGTGTIQGRVVNAFDASGVGGATVRLRSGVNDSGGTVLQTVTSNSSGQYSFVAAGGSYTVEATIAGFGTGISNVVAVGGELIASQDVRVTPGLGLGEIRVVLTWGSTPSDLDSHLAGPASGGGRFHVYYSTRAPAGSSAELDVDDTSSYGPETTTLSALRAGTYRYWIHDYSNGGNAASTVMSQRSGARVVVYRGTGAGTVTAATFNVPSGRAGNAWVVFDLDGSTGAITPINQVTSVPGASSIP